MPQPGSPREFLETLGRIAVTFQAAPAGVSGRIWEELRPWFSKLALHAAPKWLPRLSFGFPCQVPVYQGGAPQGACHRPAIAACDVCRQPCCLDHARIDQFGDAICYLCVAEAIRSSKRSTAQPKSEAEAPDHDANMTWARKTLGVKADTDWIDVKAAHRKLSAKWHPDRHRGAKAQAKAEERFKEIQRAFEVLRRAQEKEAA